MTRHLVPLNVISDAQLFMILFAIWGEFVVNFGWVLAVLLEVFLKEIQEEMHYSQGRRGTQSCEQNLINHMCRLVFPNVRRMQKREREREREKKKHRNTRLGECEHRNVLQKQHLLVGLSRGNST